MNWSPPGDSRTGTVGVFSGSVTVDMGVSVILQ